MRTKSLLASLILCLSLWTVPAGAVPMEDNPCDPDNGKYICDGTEDWPDGKCPPELCGPSMPSTGVSNIDDGADALAGGNVPRWMDVLHK